MNHRARSQRTSHGVMAACLSAAVVGAFWIIGPFGLRTATSEALSVPSPREEFLAIAERLVTGPNPEFLGEVGLARLRQRTEATDPGTVKGMRTRIKLADYLLREGENDEAIAMLDDGIEAAFAALEARRAETDPREHKFAELAYQDLIRTRALAHLRNAELENCVARHAAECCIFPLAGGGLHAVDAPARLAKKDCLAFLRRSEGSDREDDRLSAMWLLNVACMALDEYPEGVPERYRIPMSMFASETDVGRFVDVAGELGLDGFDQAGGAVVDDFDGDGHYDVVSSTCHPAGPIKAFRNRGDGSFENVAARWKLDEQLGGLHVSAADYDNDGRLDLFVPRGAWMLDFGNVRSSLLHNTPEGFVDVTREAGLDLPAPTQVGVWADFDGDGWLDLFVGRESRVEMEENGPNLPSQLYRSNGDGTFADVAAAAGVTNDRFVKGAAAGDYDDDGDMDLYVSNFGKNRLYRNEHAQGGGLRFTDVAEELGVTQPAGRSFSCWFFDYDNDGRLDIWCCAYEASLALVVRSYLGEKPAARSIPRIYRNLGNGAFEDVTKQVGIDRVWLPMGTSFGDLDEDGWLDVYLGTGDPNYETLTPNVALRNDGGRRFQDVTRSTGLGHLQKGHGVVFADIDQDGDQDIFHQLGGFYEGDAFANALFLNPGHGRRFLALELVGIETNRMGIGARVTVGLETSEGPRTLHRAMGSVSSFGNAPRRMEIGLGDATKIAYVEIRWPTSRSVQRFTDVPLDALVRATEGRDELERFELRPVPLRGDG